MKVGTLIGMFRCISVQEKSGQKPYMHAPPGGAGTAARRLVSTTCFVDLVWVSCHWIFN